MASEDAWRPAQYERFRDERSQPFYDLLAMVRPRPPHIVAEPDSLRRSGGGDPGGCDAAPPCSIVDLGCGTGELTRILHRHLGARETLGIDRSASMLEKSGAHAGDGLRFEQAEIATFLGNTGPGAFDLVFSNAALQWVPDHDLMLPKLAVVLAPGGQLAVQVPANHDHPSHLVAAEVAAEDPFREALQGYVRHSPVLSPEDYADGLDRCGFREQRVRLEVYAHRLSSREDVVEWVKGTLLTDYEQRLPPELFRQFLDRYREQLLPELADDRPYFFPFKRILFWARR